MITVSQLWSYPLKSAQGIPLKQANIEQWGLQFDRSFMLVDLDGHFLSQRQTPLLATISIQKDISNNRITFLHPKKSPLFVDPLLINGNLNVTVWGDNLPANTYSNEINAWFSDILNHPCRLVSMDDKVKRQVDLDYAQTGDITAFSDGFPILLISQASLNDLNNRLKKPVSMKRFRPNIVVTGCEAFAEDTWKTIRINGITLEVVKPCSRCIIPNTNQQTGERTVEPIKTLSSYRKDLFGIKNKIFFGQNIIQRGFGNIQLDNELTVLESI